MLLLLVACRGPAPEVPARDDSASGDGTTDSATGTECPAGPPPPEDPIPGGAPRPAEVWSGSVTWTVDFDLLAEHEGYRDCSYTRVYAELVETREQGWVCPACSVLVKGAAEIVSGYDDCYAQISTSEAVRVEQLGIGEVDGALGFFRSGAENVRASHTGPVVSAASDHLEVAWSDPGSLPGLRTLTLSAAGSFDRRVRDDLLLEDPQTPRAEPYTCGWERHNPGGPNAAWDIADGAIFPNARLEDQCGELASIWDFRGRYVVIDASSPDCGPCQEMARDAAAFEAALADRCVDVTTVTLLNEALSGVNLPASLEDRVAWAAAFGLDTPVLADLGLGYALFPPYQGRSSGMSLPSWVVLDPEGRLLGGGSGYSGAEGGFDEILAFIEADLAAREGSEPRRRAPG